MGFDDLTNRMGKRNGVSAELIAAPAALARKHERIEHLLVLFAGIAIVLVVSALTLGLAESIGRMPAVSGGLVFAGYAKPAQSIFLLTDPGKRHDASPRSTRRSIASCIEIAAERVERAP